MQKLKLCRYSKVPNKQPLPPPPPHPQLIFFEKKSDPLTVIRIPCLLTFGFSCLAPKEIEQCKTYLVFEIQ